MFPSRADSEDVLVSRHEASHAVALAMLGLRFHSVSIIPDSFSAGRVWLTEPDGNDERHQSDTKLAVLFMRRASVNARESRKRVRRMQVVAKKLIEATWPWVRDVAYRLQECRTMTYEEVHACLQETTDRLRRYELERAAWRAEPSALNANANTLDITASQTQTVVDPSFVETLN
jgi:hypothetical protein